jgi:hypothetical protein
MLDTVHCLLYTYIHIVGHEYLIRSFCFWVSSVFDSPSYGWIFLIILTLFWFYEDKGTSRHRLCHEGPVGEERYSSILSLTSALYGVGGQRHTLTALFPERGRVPSVQNTGWTHGRSGRMCRDLACTKYRSPDRPASIESLYPLKYPGSQFLILFRD